MSQFSTQMATGRRGALPQGEEVGSFASYAEAQHAVDSLSDDGFPVEYLAIVGTDLRQVEQVTGRMSWGRAIASGAMSGLWIGLFFAAMMAMFSPATGTGVAVGSAILLGVVWGILFQAVAYAMTRGRRDFTSVSHVVASRYSIIAAREASEAAQALASIPGNLSRGGEAARRAERRRATREETGSGAPSAFGSRPDEQPRFGVRVPEGASAQEYVRTDQGATGSTSAAAPVAGGPGTVADGPEAGRISSARAVAEADGERLASQQRDPYLRPAPADEDAGGEDRPEQ